MTPHKYMTAREVAEALDVSVATVYSYVSRGLLRSEQTDSSQRVHRYRIEDVEQLLVRRSAGQNPETFAKTTMHWGTPILDSAITLIDDGKIFYRGLDAIALAREHCIEDVASLIWTGDLAATDELFAPNNQLEAAGLYQKLPLNASPYVRLQMVLPLAAQLDIAAYDLRPANVAMAGARILRLMVDTLSGMPQRGAVAETLATHWHNPSKTLAPALNAAMILCADHELSASSFTARIAAAAHANPYAVVNSGLAILSGTKHGAITQRVRAFMREIDHPQRAKDIIAQRLKRGESIPGFGHNLYPEGDPRGTALTAIASQHARIAPALEKAHAVIRAMLEIVGEGPTLDFGLVMLADVVNLPNDCPMLIFALGRTVGWIGHAIEQYESGDFIRPRARYVGVQP